MNIEFEIIGNASAPETGLCSHFVIPAADVDGPLTVGELRLWFPFVGRYFFRAKLPWAGSHVWKDLVDDTAAVPIWEGIGANCTIHLRVLPLSLEEEKYGTTVAGDSEIYVEMEPSFDGESDARDEPKKSREMLRPVPRPSDTEAADEDLASAASSAVEALRQQTTAALNSEAAKELRRRTGQAAVAGVGMLKAAWKAARQGLEKQMSAGAEAGESPIRRGPTPVEAASMISLCDYFTGDGSVEHILLDLWSTLLPGEPFQASGKRWKALGFMSSPPGEDFKNSGTLALRCFLHFAVTYPAKVTLILKEQAPRTDKHYPLAIVMNNITLMVADVFRIRRDGFSPYERFGWGIFNVEGESAAMEVFAEVVCLLVRLLDARWKQIGASRGQFGELISGVRRDLEGMLTRDPGNMERLLEIAMERQLMY